MRGGHLSLEHSLAIARDLAKTISRMHSPEINVLHRDLKPANLMIRDFKNADVVVLDLGLSFDRENEQNFLTGTGETIKNELIACLRRLSMAETVVTLVAMSPTS